MTNASVTSPITRGQTAQGPSHSQVILKGRAPCRTLFRACVKSTEGGGGRVVERPCNSQTINIGNICWTLLYVSLHAATSHCSMSFSSFNISQTPPMHCPGPWRWEMKDRRGIRLRCISRCKYISLCPLNIKPFSHRRITTTTTRCLTFQWNRKNRNLTNHILAVDIISKIFSTRDYFGAIYNPHQSLQN